MSTATQEPFVIESSFDKKIANLAGQAQSLLADPVAMAQQQMPGRAFFLDSHDVLALPRDNGDSRYPYGQDGFNFWVYASGYMHSNEGLFSHFLRAAEGQEPNIAFFAGLGGKGGSYGPVSLMPVPRLEEAGPGRVQRYTVLSTTAAYFFTEVGPLRFALRVFVTRSKEICFSMRVENLSGETESFFLSSYLNPFLRNQVFETGEDRWFKQVRVLAASGVGGRQVAFAVKANEDKDRTTSITHHGLARRRVTLGAGAQISRQEQTTSRYQYVGGTRGSLHYPVSLHAGTFGQAQPVCTFTQTAVAGDLVHLTLPKNSSLRCDVVFTYTMDPAEALDQASQEIDPEHIDESLAQLERDDRRRHEGLSFSIQDPTDERVKANVFNSFTEHLKRQVDFCALIKGYVQLSPNSLIGVRDVFQAIEGQAFWLPKAARSKMLEALGYTAPNGRCFRQYSLPTSSGVVGRMDLRPFIDQGVWVISTIATYLAITGDWEFLGEECGYHEIVDESAGRVQPSGERDSVLEHLTKIMDFLLDHRDLDHTGCVRAMYGDWNDALDGLGVSREPTRAYGTGVSVMATLQVYQNCLEMAAILSQVDAKKWASRIGEYENAAELLEDSLRKYAVINNGERQIRLVHGWGDKRSYFVGGFNDPDGQARDGLTSNVFWVLSGLYGKDTSIRETILGAFERLDSKYGVKTFEPAFPENVKGVGRIGKLPPGTAENGAPYVHATTFAVMALFKMGQPRLAWEQLIKILPFTELHKNLSHSPFVMPNSYGWNEERYIDGQSMNDWQTGSSNVMLKCLIRYVFGLEPTLEGLYIQPAGWAPFRVGEFVTTLRGSRVRIVCEYRGGGERRFTVNGKAREAERDDVMGITKLRLGYEELKPSMEVRVVG